MKVYRVEGLDIDLRMGDMIKHKTYKAFTSRDLADQYIEDLINRYIKIKRKQMVRDMKNSIERNIKELTDVSRSGYRVEEIEVADKL